MASYAEVEAAGPYVDVTVVGPYRTVPLEPRLARALAHEIEQAADAIENPPPSDDLLPGLGISVSTQPHSKTEDER